MTHRRFERDGTSEPVHFGGSPVAVAFGIFAACDEVQTVLFESVSPGCIHVRTIPALRPNDERLVEAVEYWRPACVVWQHAR